MLSIIQFLEFATRMRQCPIKKKDYIKNLKNGCRPGFVLSLLSLLHSATPYRSKKSNVEIAVLDRMISPSPNQLDSLSRDDCPRKPLRARSSSHPTRSNAPHKMSYAFRVALFKDLLALTVGHFSGLLCVNNDALRIDDFLLVTV